MHSKLMDRSFSWETERKNTVTQEVQVPWPEAGPRKQLAGNDDDDESISEEAGNL